MTVAEYLRSWLDGATKVSPKTLERYGELAEKQMTPHLGALKLRSFGQSMWSNGTARCSR